MKNYLPALDGLRGGAALLVMWFHFFLIKNNQPDGLVGQVIDNTKMLGQTGVDLFFILSGFLITRILLVDKEAPHFFRNFYWKRSLRILPLYYFFLAIYWVVLPLVKGADLPRWSDCWWSLFFCQNIPMTFGWDNSGPGHYWTLAIEEHFYIMWPFLVFFLSRKWLFIASLIIVAGAMLIRIFMGLKGYEVYYFTFARMDSLAIGAILAMHEPLMMKKAKSLATLLMTTAAISLISVGLIYGLPSLSDSLLVDIIKYPLIAVFFAAVIGYLLVTNQNNIVHKLLSCRCSRYFGKISYSLYVFHILCFELLQPYIQEWPVLIKFTVSFITAILVAHVSYTYLESYFLKYKKRLYV